MEYMTQSNVIRGLSKEQHEVLCTLCRYANNLYNFALYHTRQYFFQTEQVLSYESNYPVCKENENYGLLQAGVAQQILKVANRDMKSFYALSEKAKCGECDEEKVKLPRYRKKGGMFELILSTNAIHIRDGFLYLPFSRVYRKETGFKDEIKIPFPERLQDRTIKEVRILPMHEGAYFKVQYVCHAEQMPVNVNPDNIMGIDVGVDNFATCVSNVRTPFIIDGRKMKSINQHWNKEKAKLQSIADKQGLKTTKRLQRITDRRNRQINDLIKKSARYIIEECIRYEIGTVIVGVNKEFKKDINLGKKNNQNFVQLPFTAFRRQLEYLCWLYGIAYIEQEESYTSKASFLDLDEIPVWQPSVKTTVSFSGKRIRRGLYQASDERVINADVNAGYNIIRKCKQEFRPEQLSSGLLASPLRIRLQ